MTLPRFRLRSRLAVVLAVGAVAAYSLSGHHGHEWGFAAHGLEGVGLCLIIFALAATMLGGESPPVPARRLGRITSAAQLAPDLASATGPRLSPAWLNRFLN